MRLGVYGGTFDPIHYGHLRIAEAVRESHSLERVLFVPNRLSPFKVGETATPAELRARLCELALADNPAFELWRGELSGDGPGYTVDTLRRLRTENPGAQLFFVLGLDAVRELPRWREPEALLSLARFVAVTRPGTTEEEARDAIPDGWEKNIDFLSLPGLDISATELRALVRAGRTIRYLTPPAVIACIQENQLYA